MKVVLACISHFFTVFISRFLYESSEVYVPIPSLGSFVADLEPIKVLELLN